MCLRPCIWWPWKPHPNGATVSPAAPLPRRQAEDFSKAEAIQPSAPKLTRPATTPPSNSPSQADQQQLPPVAPGLPSRVDETLAGCPNHTHAELESGIGKSSLVKNIFNIDPDKIDISHNCAGRADIEREYTSPENPRFILHDSRGFEAGSDGNWTTVENFLKYRQQNDLPGKIHAIWFCIEIPLTGARLLQTGDELLLKLAKRFNIPIIAVFTKYDLLVIQFFRNNAATSKPEKLVNAKQKALQSFDCSVKELEAASPKDFSIPCVKVSTKDPNEKESLINLTKVTRERLQHVEEELQVLWVAAQQVNARQKVDVSISEGFKKYWLDLHKSSVFEDQILIDCIHRIHDDVVKVWNFYDPNEILSSTDFFTTMIGLVKPLIEDNADKTSFSTAHVRRFGSLGAKLLVPLQQRLGLKDSAINYLYDKYQKFPSTAKLLSTYIINFILVLYGVFSEILRSDPPRPLSKKVVYKVLAGHEGALKKNTLDSIDSNPGFSAHPEQVIAIVIRKRLSEVGSPVFP